MKEPMIVVPLDGSKFAECALPYAIDMANKLNGRIGLVSVSPKKSSRRRRGIAEISVEELNQVDAFRSDYLHATAEKIEAEVSMPVFCTVLFGAAATELAEYAKVHHPELFVMSTHGRGPFSRAWIGSVADWVVRHASMPVLLIRPEDGVEVDVTDRRSFGKVLIALDGSPQAEESLRWAKAIGGENSAYILVRVARDSVPVWTSDPECAPFDVCDYQAVTRKESAEYLDGVEHLMKNGKGNVETLVVDNAPAAAGILKAAEQNAADLIAITTQGRGGLPRLILGSVTDKVVRASHVPVLVVRPKQA